MEFVRSALLAKGFSEDTVFEERFARRRPYGIRAILWR